MAKISLNASNFEICTVRLKLAKLPGGVDCSIVKDGLCTQLATPCVKQKYSKVKFSDWPALAENFFKNKAKDGKNNLENFSKYKNYFEKFSKYRNYLKNFNLWKMSDSPA